MNYEIFADVSVDVEEEYLEKEGVSFVPMEYMIGEETRCCTRPESDEMLHAYYDKLRGKVPTRTSQISPYHYIQAFEPYVKEKKPLIYLALSSGLSNTYESALMAVKTLSEDYEDVQIEVVDTLGATGGMGLLLESACKNREAGMGLKENAAWLRAQARKVNYWFKVEDLMYLMRGGRVSAATAVVGTALNIKPVLTIRSDGKLDTVAKKRGTRLAVKYMLEQFARNFDGNTENPVYISCSDCKAEAEKLKEVLLESNPNLKIRVTMLSPIIGAHTGPDMIALIYYGTNRE